MLKAHDVRTRKTAAGVAAKAARKRTNFKRNFDFDGVDAALRTQFGHESVHRFNSKILTRSKMWSVYNIFSIK